MISYFIYIIIRMTLTVSNQIPRKGKVFTYLKYKYNAHKKIKKAIARNTNLLEQLQFRTSLSAQSKEILARSYKRDIKSMKKQMSFGIIYICATTILVLFNLYTALQATDYFSFFLRITLSVFMIFITFLNYNSFMRDKLILAKRKIKLDQL